MSSTNFNNRTRGWRVCIHVRYTSRSMHNATTLILVRHAQTSWNAKRILQGSSDIPLTRKGKQQALRTAKYVQTLRIDSIYTSPLRRALETSKAIAKYHPQARLKTEKALLERGFGTLEGLDYQTIYDTYPRMSWPDTMLYPWYAPEGVEPLWQVEKRINTFLTRIKKKEKGKTVLIVSHGVTLRCLIASLLGTPAFFNLSFSMTNASLTVIRLHPVHGSEIHLLGDSRHLEE